MRSWPDLDDAFLDIVRTLKAAVQKTRGHRDTVSSNERIELIARWPGLAPIPTGVVSRPRSSNLRLRKQFSEADKDSFRDKAFEFMAKLFREFPI